MRLTCLILLFIFFLSSGLIIYEYSVVIYNSQKQTTAEKQFCAEVECHELAHQVDQPDW